MISAEYFTGGNNTLDLADPFNQNGLMNRPTSLPDQVIHELVHIQQARKSPIAVITANTVLKWALYEGVANFITSLITGTHVNNAAHHYLANNESTLWCEFFGTTNTNRKSKWLDKNLFSNPPRGLAGAFGYHIAKAYYDQSEDKDQAFEILVELNDYDDVYEKSGVHSCLSSSCE